MLKSKALVPYPAHVVMLNRSAMYMYWQWWIVNGLNLEGFLPAEIGTCRESDLSGQCRCECAHYWFF